MPGKGAYIRSLGAEEGQGKNSALERLVTSKQIWKVKALKEEAAPAERAGESEMPWLELRETRGGQMENPLFKEISVQLCLKPFFCSV